MTDKKSLEEKLKDIALTYCDLHDSSERCGLRDALSELVLLAQRSGLEMGANILKGLREKYNYTTGIKAALAMELDLAEQKIRAKSQSLEQRGEKA